MELANQKAADLTRRRLGPDDAVDLTRLLRNTRIAHAHVDWYSLVDWLDIGVVWGLEGNGRLRAFLAVGADPLPAAWVRGAAVAEGLDPLQAWQRLAGPTLSGLANAGATELAIMSVRAWPAAILPPLGYSVAAEVMTLVGDDRSATLPTIREDVTIRRASAADTTQLASIEEAAFAPIWRYSDRALSRALSQTYSFDVALMDDQIVGYQCSTSSYQGAHLARMTVHPNWQGQGIGSALMLHALHGYRRGLLRQWSLNTQVDNLVSQRLYRRFGFVESGEVLPVWHRPLI